MVKKNPLHRGRIMCLGSSHLNGMMLVSIDFKFKTVKFMNFIKVVLAENFVSFIENR